MHFLVDLLVFLTLVTFLFYLRVSLKIWTAALLLYLLVLSFWCGLTISVIFAWILILGILAFLNIPALRIPFFSKPAFHFAKKQLPTISKSEQEALKAGTISWEAELFSGMPNWDSLYAYKAVELTDEEKDFLKGPVEEICQNPYSWWDLWHKDLSFPDDLFELVKKHGLLGMIIPKEHGGKGFSVYGAWQVVMKSGKSLGPIVNLVAIANSIAAGELIDRYGTKDQKKKLLPRLANGSEIPCFALTSPVAGSDATSLEDYGVVCKGTYEGQEVLGVKLNFSKRYITMAPIATLMSLAFKLYDPDHLIGSTEKIGVTLAIVPTNLPGVTQGRRHYPVGGAFPNGPIKGKDVFIPIENIIGGQEMAGKAWEMLTQTLATGRATSLPTAAVTSSKIAFYITVLYARLRKQFGISIGDFEAVQEKLAEMAGYTYLSDAVRLFTFSQIQAGERPAIPAAISKYNTTELARKSAIHAIDILGGKGVMQGPNNPIASSYLAAPVAITIEGSNTLTRALIVFGQGAVRCHPYILKEMKALQDEDLTAFDDLIMGHTNYLLSNHVRSLLLSITGGRVAKVPPYNPDLKVYFRRLTRLSACFALLSDVCMITLGGKLKFKESLSGRFADALSMLFIGSAVLKHYHDRDYPKNILPIVEWSLQWCLHHGEQNLHDILDNLPNKFLGCWLHFFIFPLGRRYKKPSDHLNHKVAELVQTSKEVREVLAEGLFLTPATNNPLSQFEEAHKEAQGVEELNDRLHKKFKAGLLKGYTYVQRVEEALDKKMISSKEKMALLKAHEAVMKVINVDDFSLEELLKQK